MLESVLSEKFGGGPFLLQHVYQLQGICTTNTLTGPHPDCQTEIESQQDLSWVQYQSSLSWINIPTDTLNHRIFSPLPAQCPNSLKFLSVLYALGISPLYVIHCGSMPFLWLFWGLKPEIIAIHTIPLRSPIPALTTERKVCFNDHPKDPHRYVRGTLGRIFAASYLQNGKKVFDCASV